MTLTNAERCFHLQRFRAARTALLDDSEAFLEMFVCIEMLGMRLLGDRTVAGKKRFAFTEHLIEPLVEFLRPFSCVTGLAEIDGTRHIQALLKRLASARNDAVHAGAYARHLGAGCLDISLIAEVALAQELTQIEDLMVSPVVVAETWQPLAYARQAMLRNAFDGLPIWVDDNWRWLSAQTVLQAFSAVKRNDFRPLLRQTIESLNREGKLQLNDAWTVDPRTPVAQVRSDLCTSSTPVLVVDKPHQKRLMGIVTAFDLL
jgi:CBS domain-containing protein